MQIDKPYFLYIGTIDIKQKGLDLLLKAYSQIIDYCEFPLYIAGTGRLTETLALRNMIYELEIQKKVTLFGEVKGVEKEALFSKALCVVMPSRAEASPVVAIEAMARGKKIISFDIIGMNGIPKSMNMKVDPFDVTAFAEAMVQCAYNMPEKQELPALAWDTVAFQYNAFIDQILHK